MEATAMVVLLLMPALDLAAVVGALVMSVSKTGCGCDILGTVYGLCNSLPSSRDPCKSCINLHGSLYSVFAFDTGCMLASSTVLSIDPQHLAPNSNVHVYKLM